MNAKGNIKYVYHAAGTRLARITTNSLIRHSTTTLYIGGFVYQQNDTIIFTVPVALSERIECVLFIRLISCFAKKLTLTWTLFQQFRVSPSIRISRSFENPG